MEIAELAIRIDSRDAKSAEADLKRLADTGTHTERSLEGVGEGGKEAARGSDAAARSSREAAAAMDRHAEAARRVTSAVRYFAAASVAAGAAAATWMLSMSRSMDATQKMAEQIGVTTEALTGMRFAAQQFANISDQTFDMSMRRMTRRIEEAAQGGGAAKAAIEGLGFSAKELARLSPDRQMLAIADAMQRTESQARRLQYAMAIFDTEGMPLVAALQQGSAAFEENIRLAKRYGVVLSTEAAQAAADFQTEVSRLHAIVSGFSLDIANQVLPTLNRFINNAIEAATKVDGLHSEVKELTRDSAFKDWFDASLVGLARVADVAVAVAKSIGVVGLAFKAAAADVQAGLAWLAKPNAADKLLMPAEEYQRLVDEYDAAMSHQKNTVERFNAALDNLLNYQGNRFEQAAIRAINTITVTSDKITTVDLTVGGDSAGASEEQLKKLAEWTERLATPTEKLEMTLARAKAELGSLYTPEIERRIRAQYAAQQSGNKVLTEAQRIQQAFERERQQSLRTQRAAISAIHEEARGIEDQVALYGLSRTAIEDLTIARLEEQAALLSGRAGAEEQLEIFEREIEARKRLRTAIGSMEQKEAERAAWEDWSRDVEQIFGRVGQSLTDKIVDGGFKARDLLKDIFKAVTFNVLINPVMGAMQGWVTNQLGGMFGYQNPQQQGGGGANTFGMAQNASSLYSAMTGGISTTMGNGISWLGAKLGSEALSAFGLGMSGAAGAAGTAAGIQFVSSGLASTMGAAAAPGAYTMASVGFEAALGGAGAAGAAGGAAGAAGTAGAVGTVAGGGAGAAGAALAAAAPWVLGGLAVASLLSGSFEGEDRFGNTYTYQDGKTTPGSWAGDPGAEVNNAGSQMVQAAVDAINSAFAGVGSSAFVSKFYGEMETSEKDRGGVNSGGYLSGIPGLGATPEQAAERLAGDEQRRPYWHQITPEGGEFFGTLMRGDGHGPDSGTLEEMAQYLQTDLMQTVIQAWQLGIDEFPAIVQDMIKGIDADSLSLEQASAVVQQVQAIIGQVQGLQSSLEGLPFENLRDLSFDAAAGLIAAAGGLDNLNAGLTSYYQTYYSEAEQLDLLSQQLSKSFAGIGMEMPDVTAGAEAAKQAFRALFDSLDPTTEAGQQAAAVMLGVNQQFAQLATGLEQLEGAATDATNALREREGLERQLLQMQGNTAELRRRDLAALDESNRALQQHIWALQDRAQAEQEAVAGLESAYQAVAQAGQAEIARLRESFTGTDSAMTAYRGAVQRLESQFGSLISVMDQGVSTLRGQVDATARMQYDQARAVISTALVTGKLPQTADLTEALRTAQQGVTGQVYGSRFEQQRAYAILANEMEALKGIAAPELDTARATLAQMEEQYALLRGTQRIESDSLAALEQQLRQSFGAEEAARAQISITEQQLEATRQHYEALTGIRGAIDSGVMTLSAALANYAHAAAPLPSGTTPGGGDYYDAKLAQLQSIGSTHGGIDWSRASASDVAAYFASAGITPLEHWEQWGRYEGLKRPSFDVGTSYVPRDMTANIHRGEIIIDPRSSDILRRYGIGVQAQGQGSADVVAAIGRLEKRLDKVEAAARSTAVSNKRIEEMFDAVTQGGPSVRATFVGQKEPIEVKEVATV